MTSDEAKWEIRQAIRQLARRPARIRVLPTLPQFEYVFWCRHCGSHTYTLYRLDGGWDSDEVKICSLCGNMGDRAEMEWDREAARRVRWKGCRDAGWPN